MNWFILDYLDEIDSDNKDEKSFETVEQLTEQMITLSLLPRSKWQNLLNLETIKVFVNVISFIFQLFINLYFIFVVIIEKK